MSKYLILREVYLRQSKTKIQNFLLRSSHFLSISLSCYVFVVSQVVGNFASPLYYASEQLVFLIRTVFVSNLNRK